MAEFKIPLLAVVGPTGSGKTALGVELCRIFGGEVVSCDSMQIYRGMDIATAKPTAQETGDIPHHLIDFAGTDEIFSVAKYCALAGEKVAEITGRGKIPVIVGGTGLYYSSFVDNITFLEEETDFCYREELRERAESEGAQALLDELALVDPEAASRLHVNNLPRIIRALEIYHSTGRTKTWQDEMSKNSPSPYSCITVCLDARDRNVLYDRINLRVDRMVEAGLVEEAERFFAMNAGKTAVQAIGYKELKPYFDGEKSLEECIENLKMQTRHYAKRQLTWFRRDSRIKFFYIDDYPSFPELVQAVASYIREERELNEK